MIGALLLIFALAILAPGIRKIFGNATGWLLAIPVLGITGYYASFLPFVAGGGVVRQSVAWVPSLGLDLAFRADGWSLLFLLLIAGIGALIVIYAGGYLHGDRQEGRFFAYLFLFMGAMLGLVSADNLLLMFVFWELTSLASYLLIGFNHDKKESRAAALQALLVTGGGGLALLAGFLLLGQAGGSFSFSVLLEQPDRIREHALYLPILLLVLAGAFTKSAQFPFHFWLPNAMAAPTPVSAYLHSATMVKAGIFLLGRFYPLLGATEAWHYIVTTIGAATMLIGALLALPQTDLKKLLAYSTVSALGTLTMLLGLGTMLAVKAATVFLLVHSLYKGALFMVAGAVDHEAGTRDVRSLSGLVKIMPITAVAAGCAALSMSGFPPLLGFIGKELLYEANLQAPDAAFLITSAGVAANVIMVAVAIIVGFLPFRGPAFVSDRTMHEPPVPLWLGPIVLATVSVMAGIFPSLVDRPLVAAAVSAIRAESTIVDLKLWHGINPVLLLSVATVLAGTGLYLLRDRVRAVAKRLAPLARFGPESGYDLGLRTTITLADRQTRLLQHGRLRGYVLTVLVVASALAGFAVIQFGHVRIGGGLADVFLHEAAIGAVILAAALFAARTKTRMGAVISLGVVGYGVALIFALYGAPDLAITQVLIETLTLVLFVLVVVHLPRFSEISSPRRRLVDAGMAAGAGLVMTLLIYKALFVEPYEQISDYYAENATLAQGRNVVNVILVDFRALDTLGELTVLASAALGVFALIRLRPAKRKEDA